MIHNITCKLRKQIHHFSGKLCYGLCKPARRFVEKTIRFIKQSYQEENVRVMTYERLRNMASVVMAGSSFAAVYPGQRAKFEILALHIIREAKRIFGIPDFRYYAIAYGIKTVLSRIAKRLLQPRRGGDPPEAQLLLFPLEILV